MLLLGEAPQAALRATLNAFARYASLALRSADVYRRVGDKEEQLAAVVHGMPNPVIVVDQDARFVMVNGSAAELFELAGAFEVGHPVAGRLGNPALEAMLRPGSDFSQQLELALGRGEPRVYHAAVRQVASLGGRPLGRVLVLDDVTTEAETDQMKADFVAVIGHELRTPTTVIKGYLHTLINRGDALDNETRQLALGSIDANADRLIRLIEDLLFVSSIDSNRATLHVEEIDLGELVDTYRGDRVSVRRPRRELQLSVDRAKVDQVLHHLVENALKYSQADVRIEVANRGDEVHVAASTAGRASTRATCPASSTASSSWTARPPGRTAAPASVSTSAVASSRPTVGASGARAGSAWGARSRSCCPATCPRRVTPSRRPHSP